MADALTPEDIALLRLLPVTLSGVPMKKPLVQAGTLRELARIEALRLAGLLTAERTFPGGGVFNLTAMITPAGAEAARRGRAA